MFSMSADMTLMSFPSRCENTPPIRYAYSTVRHSYPGRVPGVEDDWFAEHMLPEGAHNHPLDWTVMFLNRDKPALDEGWPKSFDEERNGKLELDAGMAAPGGDRHDFENASQDPSSWRGGEGAGGEGEGNEFLYCINLVKVKDDPSVRRGAVVRAMCICSRYNFIEVSVSNQSLTLRLSFSSTLGQRVRSVNQ